MGVALLVHYTARQSEHTAAEKEVACAEQKELAPGLATAGSPHAPRGENVPRSTRHCHRLTIASFNAVIEGVVCKYTALYSLCPKIKDVLGFCATSLIRFVENACNIYIFK